VESLLVWVLTASFAAEVSNAAPATTRDARLVLEPVFAFFVSEHDVGVNYFFVVVDLEVVGLQA
jgi:hypothetical protein